MKGNYGGVTEIVGKDACTQYGIWVLILLVLIFIVLIAIAWGVNSAVEDIKKSVILPIGEKVERIESRFASVDARARELGMRLELWEKAVRGTVNADTVEKAKLAIENLAFQSMC